MRISDWSSDVCSSDLLGGGLGLRRLIAARKGLDRRFERAHAEHLDIDRELFDQPLEIEIGAARAGQQHAAKRGHPYLVGVGRKIIARVHIGRGIGVDGLADRKSTRLNSSHSCATRMTSSA